MKAAIQFEATTREGTGKGAARALRRAGQIPAVLYSNGRANQSFSLTERDIATAYSKGGFQNKLVAIQLDGKTVYAVPKALQFHPVTDRIEHADFLQVEKGNVIVVKVPVKTLNADKSMGLKRGGTLNIVRHQIELFCDPENIPSSITVDMKDANIGDSIHISDITLPEGAKPVAKNDFTVVTITGRGGKDEDETKQAAAAPAGKK